MCKKERALDRMKVKKRLSKYIKWEFVLNDIIDGLSCVQLKSTN